MLTGRTYASAGLPASRDGLTLVTSPSGVACFIRQATFLAPDLFEGFLFDEQPLRLLGEDRVALPGGDRIGDSGAGEPRVGDAQTRSDDLPGVGAIAPQIGQPFGRVLLPLIELVPGNRSCAELLRGHRKVNTELLRRGAGFHCLRGPF